MPREQRRLAAIVSADVAGYSRLMSRDESGTLAALKGHRQELVDPLVTEHGGRVVKSMGDGLLLEFPSVVDAVRCAVAVQEGMAKRSAGMADEGRILFRVGINVGDIIVEGDDIYGDGVNVAARLEQLAEPGGICVSDRAYRDVRGRLNASFADSGENVLKNIAEPVRVWRWTGAAGPAVSVASRIELALPDKPSIAVLPFQNMSGDPSQDYFADGMVDDITTALSRIRSFFVIARNSAFAYKGKTVDARQIGRELGVRYLLEGSVRKAGSRLRITGQLIHTGTGAHLWADRFEGTLEDVFDLQDRVTVSVAGAIEPSVTHAEVERAWRVPTANLDAYDLLLRAIGEAELYSREGHDRALHLARQAVQLDARYALAHAHIASWLGRSKLYGWVTNEAEETAEGARLAHLAVQLDPNHPTVLAEAAFGLAHLTLDTATAIPWFDRAIALNPNSAMALGRGAIVRNFAGDYATAAEHADRAMRLSPFDPFMFAFSLARATSHLCRRELTDAVNWARKAAQENPRHAPTFRVLGAALAHSERLDEARAVIKRLLELQPAMSAAWLRQHRLLLADAAEYLIEGARKAGLPE